MSAAKSRTIVVRDEVAKQRIIRGIQMADLQDSAGRWLLVTIARKQRRRSLRQNALYWAWMKIVADFTGGDSDEIHLAFRGKFLGYRDVAGQSIPRSTAKTETPEFAEYLNKIEAYCATELGLVLPQPNDPEAWDAFQAEAA